ncbi:methionine aminotransferase [Arcticibacter tournemirensis]|uniref:Aminotransferase class I/II-fold pyridoxal phosphate-dependent enzyme n=2 Tax=Pseudomonadati TaxID=3379134 RepID=A0A4Q0MCT5_9SPHI|nr:methionine aminotransferase [Arcticibacter tournemirensis]RXF71171.1 aminotransferase class I/II-fold pyridoxal phosphate-dependent enzyme [Arcticibacter tournemirensis]
MTLSLPKKYSASGTTIFTQMSALAQQHNAINLSQGFPDFEVDPALGDLLLEASRKGFNQYAPMAGLPGLREEISRHVRHTQSVMINPDTEITLTPGATCAIYTALATVLQTGDEAIVFEPAYDSYIPNIEMNGAKAITVPLNAPSFSVDWNRVRNAITPKTKAIILTTPHNPTGTVLEQADWEELADIIRDTGIIIISDEVYEQLVYDNKKHISILQHPELRMRSFVIYSFGKAFHITGWKIGYCIASPKLSEAFRKIHQFLSFSINTPAQYALTEYLRLPGRQVVSQLMQEKRDLFLSLIEKTPFTIYQPSAGSYFQLAGYERISTLNERDFTIWLTENFGVATIPVSAFYRNSNENRLIRLCFAKKEETLIAATERLKNINTRS